MGGVRCFGGVTKNNDQICGSEVFPGISLSRIYPGHLGKARTMQNVPARGWAMKIPFGRKSPNARFQAPFVCHPSGVRQLREMRRKHGPPKISKGSGPEDGWIPVFVTCHPVPRRLKQVSRLKNTSLRLADSRGEFLHSLAWHGIRWLGIVMPQRFSRLGLFAPASILQVCELLSCK